jgi:hypothetical protein
VSDDQLPDWHRALTDRAQKEADSLPEPTVQATQYVVSCLPEGEDRHHFSLNISYRGNGQWAVIDTPYCLSSNGTWDFEHTPSERTDEWIATHRFDFDAAQELAKQHARLMHVNGFTVADAFRMQAKRKETRP